jgi:hypothetical protein
LNLRVSIVVWCENHPRDQCTAFVGIGGIPFNDHKWHGRYFSSVVGGRSRFCLYYISSVIACTLIDHCVRIIWAESAAAAAKQQRQQQQPMNSDSNSIVLHQSMLRFQQ